MAVDFAIPNQDESGQAPADSPGGEQAHRCSFRSAARNCARAFHSVTNTGPVLRPLSRRGSSRAVLVCQIMMSMAPPLRRTLAQRFGRSSYWISDVSLLLERVPPRRAAAWACPSSHLYLGIPGVAR